MKRHLPARFAASNASSAPPGPRIRSMSSWLSTACTCQRSTWSVCSSRRPEGGLQVLRRPLRGAGVGLGGEEDVLADAPQPEAVGLLGAPSPVAAGAVEV